MIGCSSQNNVGLEQNRNNAKSIELTKNGIESEEMEVTSSEVKELEVVSVEVTTDNKLMFDGYNLIEVEGGNQSGYRESNAVVDIGYDDREYYAFTNENGQLVNVIASEIVLKNGST